MSRRHPLWITESEARAEGCRPWRTPKANAPPVRPRERSCPRVRATWILGQLHCWESRASIRMQTPTEDDDQADRSANRYRSRATAYMARNRHAISSAGPRSFCRKKKASDDDHTAQHRQQVLESGQPPPSAKFLRASRVGRVTCAKKFPSFCEVSGQKEDDENANDLGGLKSQEIDLRVTAGWSGTEENECGREHKACDAEKRS